MVRPAMFLRTAGGVDYLAGNAQVFDGSFNYDTIAGWVEIAKADTFSMCLAFNYDTIFRTEIIWQQGLAGNNKRLIVLKRNDKLEVIMGDGSNLIRVQGTASLDIGYNKCVITYDGGGLVGSFGFSINGTTGTTVITNQALGTIVSGQTTAYIGATNTGAALYDGTLKILELIDSEATAGQVSDAIDTGSFRGAGIAYDSGQYLLAVDFDKANGQNPTTFAGTPAYTITALGGATYVDYE